MFTISGSEAKILRQTSFIIKIGGAAWLPYCFLVSGLLDLHCIQEIIDREAKKIEEIGERLSSQTPPAKGIFYFKKLY
jgi:hypothetical protein